MSAAAMVEEALLHSAHSGSSGACIRLYGAPSARVREPIAGTTSHLSVALAVWAPTSEGRGGRSSPPEVSSVWL
eukprot:7384367-Prymnesium_polylepis.1